jgi:5-methylcytosine-specific restriction protein A
MDEITAYSWTVYPPDVAVKRRDKSAFVHHGTGVPQEIWDFFGLSVNQPGKKEGHLLFKGGRLPFHFQLNVTGSRFRLFWMSDFEKEIRRQFPQHYAQIESGSKLPEEVPLLRLQKLGDSGDFQVDFIFPQIVQADSDNQDEDSFEPKPEGMGKRYWSTRYERNPENRRRAMEIHGLDFAVCGLNFGKVYGELGENFIEVHHKKPLAGH